MTRFSLAVCGSVSLAGLTTHLSEVCSTAELELQHQWAISHFVHIFALFSVGNGGTVTFTFTLLHRWRPGSFWTIARRLSSVGETLHSSHLLSKATLSRTLAPVSRHPSRRRAAPQTAADADRRLALLWTLSSWEGFRKVTALAQNNPMLESWATFWSTFRPVQSHPLRWA